MGQFDWPRLRVVRPEYGFIIGDMQPTLLDNHASVRRAAHAFDGRYAYPGREVP